MKVVSPNIIHKTGRRRCDYRRSQRNRSDGGFCAYHEQPSNLRIRCASRRDVVEEMISRARNHHRSEQRPTIRPTIMFGLGGVLTEIPMTSVFSVCYRLRAKMLWRMNRRNSRETDIGRVSQATTCVQRNAGRSPGSAAHMGTDLGPELDSVDFNPILVWGNEHRVLDVKILRRSQPCYSTNRTAEHRV